MPESSAAYIIVIIDTRIRSSCMIRITSSRPHVSHIILACCSPGTIVVRICVFRFRQYIQLGHLQAGAGDLPFQGQEGGVRILRNADGKGILPGSGAPGSGYPVVPQGIGNAFAQSGDMERFLQIPAYIGGGTKKHKVLLFAGGFQHHLFAPAGKPVQGEGLFQQRSAEIGNGPVQVFNPGIFHLQPTLVPDKKEQGVKGFRGAERTGEDQVFCLCGGRSILQRKGAVQMFPEGGIGSFGAEGEHLPGRVTETAAVRQADPVIFGAFLHHLPAAAPVWRRERREQEPPGNFARELPGSGRKEAQRKNADPRGSPQSPERASAPAGAPCPATGCLCA